MSYIKQFSAFFEKANCDSKITSIHICLYASLIQYWNLNRFNNPFSISRADLMKTSKISAKATYHKCMRDLHDLGYIKYEPSFNPYKGSLIFLIVDLPVQNMNTNQTVKYSATSSENSTLNEKKATLSNIYTNNNLYKDNIESVSCSKIEQVQKVVSIKKKSQSLKQSNRQSKEPLVPQLDEVTLFFKSENQSDFEAQRFFNHFESNGWRVGGKTPMKNWHAAARNWMLNTTRFASNQPAKPPQLSKPSPNGKNYAEPL